jgi:hypothetical protein
MINFDSMIYQIDESKFPYEVEIKVTDPDSEQPAI